MRRSPFVMLTLIVLLTACTGARAADDYPNKPITFVVPLGAGGMTDVTARLLAEKLKVLLGQPITIANNPGGTGIVGVNFALSQKEDGWAGVNVGQVGAPPYFLRHSALLDHMSSPR